MRSSWSCKKAGISGFSTTWTAASAAERVIVTIKPVATNPSRHEHQQLAPPEREQPLQHRDRALPVRALLGDAPVHRQGPEEGQEHDEVGWRWARAPRLRAPRCPGM